MRPRRRPHGRSGPTRTTGSASRRTPRSGCPTTSTSSPRRSPPGCSRAPGRRALPAARARVAGQQRRRPAAGARPTRAPPSATSTSGPTTPPASRSASRCTPTAAGGRPVLQHRGHLARPGHADRGRDPLPVLRGRSTYSRGGTAWTTPRGPTPTRPFVAPDEVAGLPRRGRPEDFGAVGVYGRGPTAVLAIPLRDSSPASSATSCARAAPSSESRRGRGPGGGAALGAPGPGRRRQLPAHRHRHARDPRGRPPTRPRPRAW